MTEIVELKDFIPAYTNAVQKLLEQLTNRPVKLTETTLKEIISQENTHLFFLLADQEIAGMLTVGIYHSPTGGKAWIEDVVMDEKYRGQGFSKQLVTHAVYPNPTTTTSSRVSVSSFRLTVKSLVWFVTFISRVLKPI